MVVAAICIEYDRLQPIMKMHIRFGKLTPVGLNRYTMKL